MQIRNGKIYVANGSTTVYGVGVDWSNVEAGDIFVVLGSSAFYWVNAVDTGVTPATITLNTPYVGDTITSGAATNGNYAVHQDFTPNKKLPLLNAGDIETATIFSRAMQILDNGLAAVESGGAGSSGGITVNQTAHGFVAGSAVRFDGDEYTLCFGDTLTQAIADGIVSEVIDVDSFKLLTSGAFESSYNFTNGSGKTFGPGDQANVSPDSNNLVASDSAAATVFVPIVRAIGASSGATTQTGLITNIGGSNANTFAGAGTAGLVPDPGSATGKFLRDDGTWQTITIGANTVNYDSLLLGTAENADPAHADWDANFWDAWLNGDPEDNNEKSIYWAIRNTYERLLLQESVGTVIREKVFSGIYSTNPATVTTTTWTVPSGITKVKVRAHSGTHLSYLGRGLSMPGFLVVAVLTVVPAEVLTITLPNLPVLINPPNAGSLNNLAENQVARPHLTIERSGAVTMLLVPGAPGGRGVGNNVTGYQGGQSTPIFHATDGEEISSREYAPAPVDWGNLTFPYGGSSGTSGGQATGFSYPTPAEVYAPGAVKLEWLGS